MFHPARVHTSMQIDASACLTPILIELIVRFLPRTRAEMDR